MCCGSRSIGVVLTGTLGDGASGLWALKQCGGVAVVQDPRDAAFSQSAPAVERRPDRAARRDAALLQQLVGEPAGGPVPVPEHIQYEVEIARDGPSSMQGMDRIGTGVPL